MTIPNLSTSDSFKTWFDRTNTVISEINGITIHDLRAGDGIGVTSVSNVFTVSHGSLVATGVTFSGPVNFTNSVAFSTSPTIDATVVTISPKSAGITIGNVVRMAGSGLTLAKADTAENAEVLGVVVNSTASYDMVAVAGSINNKNFTSTIRNILGIVGGTLGAGTPYFLDPVVAGGVTTVEPTTYKHVSKPVILGISGDLGSIIPYRGVEIDGISAGITAELDNKIIIEFDTDIIASGSLGISESGTPIKVGDFFTLENTDFDLIYNSPVFDGTVKTMGKVNNGSRVNGIILESSQWGWEILITNMLGVVSKIISKTGNVYILEITLQGGTFKVLQTDLDTTLYAHGPYETGELWYSSEDGFSKSIYNNKQFDSRSIAWPYNLKFASVINDPTTNELTISLETGFFSYLESKSSVASVISTFQGLFNSDFQKLEYDNLLVNGNLNINQRGITLINETVINNDRKLFNPIADRWFVVGAPINPDATNPLGVKPGSNEIWGQTFDNLNFSVKLINRNRFSLPVAFTHPQYRLNRNYFEISCAYGTTVSKYIDNTDATTVSNTNNSNPHSIKFLRLENLSNNLRSILSASNNASDVPYSFAFRAKLTGTAATGITLNVIQNMYADPFWYENVGATGWWQKLGFHTAVYEKISPIHILAGAAWETYYIKGLKITGAASVHSNKSINIFSEDEGWYSIGFEIPHMPGYTLGISDVALIKGDGFTGGNVHALINYTPPEQEIKECSKYYLRTYDWYLPTKDISQTQKRTFYQLQLGNLITEKTYTVQFPIQMKRRILSPINGFSAEIYSPFSGITGEAFNVNKNKDMFVQGDGTRSFENLPWQSTQITRSLGAQGQNIQIDSVNTGNMVVTINDGAVSMDKLQFHYVVDGDFNPKTTLKP